MTLKKMLRLQLLGMDSLSKINTLVAEKLNVEMGDLVDKKSNTKRLKEIKVVGGGAENDGVLDRILAILVYGEIESDADFDDDAAIIAMKRMLVVIFNDCEDSGAIEDLINSATETDMTRWIIEYEVAYILEYSIQVFKSHIFDKSENPNGVRSEIERWLRREIEEKMRDKISQIELNTPEGIEEIETLTAEILVIWGQE